MSILIAEDNPLILKSLAYAFSQTPFEVLCAVDGMQAKDIFEKEQPSFVLSDIMMPFLSGLELIEHIRETEQKYTKIIILSAMGMEDTVAHAFEMGIDDYMVKPFISSELLSRVKRLLRYQIK